MNPSVEFNVVLSVPLVAPTTLVLAVAPSRDTVY